MPIILSTNVKIQTIEEFHNIFGPELKAVTGDSEKIEEVVSKVDCLVLDIETVRFDPYNPLNRYTSYCCSCAVVYNDQDYDNTICCSQLSF